jgi:hypothetical protein
VLFIAFAGFEIQRWFSTLLDGKYVCQPAEVHRRLLVVGCSLYTLA